MRIPPAVSTSVASPRIPAGFTLIELMVALAVAGVLLSVAVPSYRDGLLSNRAKAVATDIHLSFLLARSESLKRSKDVEIVANGGSWINGWRVRVKTSAEVLRSTDASTDVSLDCGSSPGSASGTCDNIITFGRNGRPPEYVEFRASIAEKTSIQARCVSISLSGQPRVTVDTDNDPDNGCN